VARARLLSTPGARPYLREAVSLPAAERELFFDLEVDPMRDVCYLHGILERSGGDTTAETFMPFFAEDPTRDAEEDAFRRAWTFLRSAKPFTLYYYSKYERTIYRKLREKYSHVCSEADVEELFEPVRAVDLYFDVVKKVT